MASKEEERDKNNFAIINAIGSPSIIYEVAKEIRKRFLKSFLDIAILARTEEIGCMSATYAIAILKREYGVKFSPGTIYPLIKKLEQEGFIKRLSNLSTSHYVLTDKGKNKLEIYRQYPKHSQSNLFELIRSTFRHLEVE